MYVECKWFANVHKAVKIDPIEHAATCAEMQRGKFARHIAQRHLEQSVTMFVEVFWLIDVKHHVANTQRLCLEN